MPWTAAQEKLITAFASDNTPDICQLGNTWIPQFAALYAIIPLDNLIASSDKLNRGRYFDGIWRTNIIDGKIYGIPWYVDTRVLYYRKGCFAACGILPPPRNWEELLDASKK
ncbi:MAG: extracellular solute-binding protein [Ignavibacteriales bacterium]|nr:extracellular solute-binding protein [Ignavibacteriales bacterium]